MTRHCRVCRASLPPPWLDLGRQPLANAFRPLSAALRGEFRAPLAVTACPRCALSQLTHVVPRETLYADYAYRSGVSAGWHRHCEALAAEWARPGMVCLDIASNDGTLVRALAARGATAVGVEPAPPPDATYSCIRDWWGEGLVRLAFEGRVELLTAQNVLGHVDDVHDFMAGVALALAPRGVALIEVPYLGALLDSLAFDTIYHEHLSYWSITALARLAFNHGLTVSAAQPIPTHGGSIRVVLRQGEPVLSRAIQCEIDREVTTLSKRALQTASTHISQRIGVISAALAGRDYIGFGAPAKASVLLGCLDCRALPRVVYDETPAKQGRCVPGTHVPIEPLPARLDADTAVVFAWNYKLEALAKLRSRGFRGSVFVPQPHAEWLRVG